jgi:hypothetical protein
MSMVALSDVKTHLGVAVDDTDTQLQASLDAAETWVAQTLSVGDSLASHTVTQRCTGGGLNLVLTSLPVLSVTSVTGVYSGALTLANLDVDLEHGLIGYLPGLFVPFYDPVYTVVYSAGFATLPADLIYAVKEATRGFWQPQRGGGPSMGANQLQMEGLASAQRILDNRILSGFA